MLLHQQPPSPDECVKENCVECNFLKRCREIVQARFKGSRSMKEIEEIARKNSLGSLEWEDYTPDK